MNASESDAMGEPRPLDFRGVLHFFTGNRYGGIEKMLATMARSPLFAGQSYALVSPGRLHEELSAARADVTLVGPFRARRPWQAWSVRKKLAALMNDRGVHTVVTHMAIPHALAAPVVGPRSLVYYAHEVHRGVHWSERWASRSRRPDAVVAGSALDAASVPTVFPGIEPEVVYYATEFDGRGTGEERFEVRRELQTPLDAKVVILAARLSPYKGHELLLEALGRVNPRHDWRLWVAGGAQTEEEARYERRLKQKAVKLGIAERVSFLGERRDVSRLLSAADLQCQPNIRPEPFGLCFVEALWAGLPVVTSAIGGALEIVTPELGELVPVGDGSALAAALERCMLDPQRAEAARRDGPGRARFLCSPESFAKRLGGALDRARQGRN